MDSLSCPWEGFEPATLKFCEAAVCGWIRQPANTWSNLAYIVVGIFVILRRDRTHPFALWSIGLMGISVGLMSFLYHASLTFFGEVLDFGSMYVLSCMLIVMNLLRLRVITTRTTPILHAALVASSIFLLIILKTAGIAIFTSQLIVAGILEFRCYRNCSVSVQYRHYLLGLGFFGLSYAIWLLDYHGIVCDPDNHWAQGHAAWHILNSTVFYFAYRFYSQFDYEHERAPTSLLGKSKQL